MNTDTHKSQNGTFVIGNGTPIVLLHSSLSSKAQWQNLVDELKLNHRVIVLDLYGYGEAPMPDQSGNFRLVDEMQYAYTRIEEVLKGERFHLIGHSYGAATALRLAHEYLPRLLSLAIYEPVAFHLLPKDEPVYRSIRAVADDVERLVGLEKSVDATRRFIDFWSGDGVFDNLPSTKQQEFVRDISKVVLDFQALFAEPLGLTDYQLIDRPACLICSDQSPTPTRQIAKLLSQTLPDVSVHKVDGGHMAPITHSHLVNPLLVNFLADYRVDANH